MRGDLSHARRQIRRAPAFAAIFAATIGVGLGASLTIFMLIDHVFVQPLDVRDASRLVVLQRMTQTGTIGQAWLRVSLEYRPGVLSRPQSLGIVRDAAKCGIVTQTVGVIGLGMRLRRWARRHARSTASRMIGTSG